MTEAPEPVARMLGRAARIGVGGLDESLVNLKPGLMELGPSAEMRDPASGFGLRMTAISASVRELRVFSPAGSRYVSLGMQTNYDDPFGRQWTTEQGGGIAVLQPGEQMEWHVRLEIFPILKHAGETP